VSGQFHALDILLLYAQNTRHVASTSGQDTGEVKNPLPQMKRPAILITCKSEYKTWHNLYTVIINLFLIPGYSKMLSVEQIKQHAEGAIYFG
jgi:hypothetical protein